MKVYNSFGILCDIDEYFKPVDPIDNGIFERLKNICPNADVILQDDEATVCVTINNIAEVSGMKRNMICGVNLLFNQTDGKYSGFGFYLCPEDNYKSGEYAIFYNNSINSLSQTVKKYFPEIIELIGYLNEISDLGDTKSVLRNILIIDRTLNNVDNKDRWELYQRIKSESINAHYKENKIYFKLKEGIEGIVRICNNGRLEYNGNFFKTVDTFLKCFRNGIDYNLTVYGDDPLFKDMVMKGETL